MLAWGVGVALVAVVAVLAGFAMGFRLRGGPAEAESAKAKAELDAARTELAQARAESAARAGFEALAAERASSIEQISAERDEARAELKAKSESEAALAARVSARDTELRKERENRNTERQKDAEAMAEKLALLEAAKKSLSDQFQALAAEILEQKSKTFSEGSQKELGTLLDPLRTQIKEFREKVEQAQSDSRTGVTKLETLVGILNKTNEDTLKAANNLTTALRGSAKAQGDWGEFILRDLLEKAGLREGEQFSFQQSFAGVETDDGERMKTARTDVIVKLPGERCLVIDSKVSLNAYTDYANAADDAARSAALKLHLASLRGHVMGLSKAGYHRLPGIETPDFVVMFVPIEPAFLMALQNDQELWADAYKQGILLVGPTTLLYIIRIVNVLWQQETQARNVKDVMDRGAKLYEKFAGFVNDMEDIGKSLRDASGSYEDARKKLSQGPGNLIKQVEMLRQLGVKPRKTIPAKLLEAADVEETELALAAEAEDGNAAVSAS